MEVEQKDYDTETLNLLYDITVIGIGVNVRHYYNPAYFFFGRLLIKFIQLSEFPEEKLVRCGSTVALGARRRTAAVIWPSIPAPVCHIEVWTLSSYQVTYTWISHAILKIFVIGTTTWNTVLRTWWRERLFGSLWNCWWKWWVKKYYHISHIFDFNIFPFFK